MKRPLLIFVISFIVGIISFIIINSIFFIFLISICLSFILLIIIYNNKNLTWIFAGIFLFYIAGAAEYCFFREIKLGTFAEFEGSEVELTGFINSESDKNEKTVNYVVKTEKLKSFNKVCNVKEKILISAYMPDSKFMEMDYGQKIIVRGKLEIPEKSRNPGGFDYRKYLAQKGVYGTVFINQDDLIILKTKQKASIYKSALLVKNRIIDSINRNFSKKHASLLNAMMIGYKNDLDDDLRNSMERAGIVHIMAVSGMHAAFIMIPFYMLFYLIRCNKKTANFIMIFLLIFYAYITGFTASVTRAVIMAVIVLTARLINRESDILTSVSLAALLILVNNPYSIYGVGFQLSFSATLAIIFLHKKLRSIIKNINLPKFFKDYFTVSASAQIGLIPLTAFYFNTISVIALLLNIIVIPIVQVVIFLGLFMVIFAQFSSVLTSILSFIIKSLLNVLINITEFSAEIPLSCIKVITPSLLIILLYYLVLLFIVYRKKLHDKIKQVIILSSVFILILICIQNIPYGLEVIFLDVGQGDSIFIKTNSSRNILIDGGGDEGERIVPDFLLDYGVNRVDVVVATHAHDDHIKGLIPVLRDFRVGCLILPGNSDIEAFESITEIAESKSIPIAVCYNGGYIKADKKTCFRILNPFMDYKISKSAFNNSSLVLKLKYGFSKFLFTGDIESETENMLIYNKINMKSDILKIAHHGSDTSTTELFIEAVSPAAGIISVGRNHFGNPSKNVMKRLKENNIKTYRTDKDGAVIIKTNGSRIRLCTFLSSSRGEL